MRKLSIIIPVLNEEPFFSKQQNYLKSFSKLGHEIIVVDGGSTDGSIATAKKLGCKCLITKASRGFQLHAGANASSNDILVFLHADTILPQTAIDDIETSFKNTNASWGRFKVAFDNEKLIFKIIAWFMNNRSCITGIATGDHTLFIKRGTYFDSGGFSDISIMEDIELCKRLKKYSNPLCLVRSVIN